MSCWLSLQFHVCLWSSVIISYREGFEPNLIYFNELICGFCKYLLFISEICHLCATLSEVGFHFINKCSVYLKFNTQNDETWIWVVFKHYFWGLYPNCLAVDSWRKGLHVIENVFIPLSGIPWNLIWVSAAMKVSVFEHLWRRSCKKDWPAVSFAVVMAH